MLELTDVTLTRQLDELAAFEPGVHPFVSLYLNTYLNTQADEHGRDNFDSFVRKEFKARAKAFAPESPELASFERDAARIKTYLRDELRPSADGLAIVTVSVMRVQQNPLSYPSPPASRHNRRRAARAAAPYTRRRYSTASICRAVT